ncbi:MAG: hypothetical protein Q9220_002031 [cf. Caloplaca sp. 1 TL-2023]
MRRAKHDTTSLPRHLKEELGFAGDSKSSGRRQTLPGLRKERRKAARVEKKVKRPLRREYSDPRDNKARESGPLPEGQAKTSRISQSFGKSPGKEASLKASSKNHKSKQTLAPEENEARPSLPPSRSSPSRNVSRGLRDKLAADDAEIAALEKALGVKGKKKLPKSFEDDGLDVILGGLEDGSDGSDDVHGKRKRDDSQEWLEGKRKKARRNGQNLEIVGPDSSDDREESGTSFTDQSDGENESQDEASEADSEEDHDSQDSGRASPTTKTAKKTVRENPYRAPFTAAVPTEKYIPPSLRAQNASETEDLSRLRRRIQGLINRLSEANLLSILRDIEALYQSNPRQHMSSTLIDILLGLLSDPAILSDTFVILHAGFIAAVYKTIGTDFGAQVVQQIDDEFSKNYEMTTDSGSQGKTLTNLISLLSYMYTFQIISSNMIYDYIKIFIRGLSEGTAELLLKVLRNSGPQLRQDNPSALKEIVLLVQDAVVRVGESNLSVRTKFMIETMNNLKNNRVKTGMVASSTVSEHVVRMKKSLGSLNARSVKASEPLRIGLQDIRESDRRGKWWLVGASYKDQEKDAEALTSSLENLGAGRSAGRDHLQDAAGDLLQIAREQRMNTDVRRAIFVAVMSATDYNDAFQRLMKLRLRKSQELEIPKVLIHCAAGEEAYNPYYTLLARRICSDRKLKMAFQFSLWHLFKDLEEHNDDEDDRESREDDDEKLSMRSIVNLAKMFGTLIAEGGLALNIFKVLDFTYLQPKTGMFIELMIITTILQTQKGLDGSRDEGRIAEIFMKARESPDMAEGLQYFLKKTVSKTDVAGTKADKETTKWGCMVARDAIRAVLESQTANT